MNIWFINHFAYGPDQSAGTRHYEFARILQERGHVPLIIASSFYHKGRAEMRLSSGETYRRSLLYDVPFQWLRTPPYKKNQIMRFWNMAVFAWRVYLGRWKLASDQPDVIIGSSPSLLAAYSSYLLARKFKVPFIFEIRDIWPDSLRDVAGLSKWNPIYILFKFIERFLYRNSDYVVTLLPNSFQYIVSNGGVKNKIVCIPNGVDLTQRPPLPRSSTTSPFIITYFGAHGPYNGLEQVIEAAVFLRDRGWNGNIIRFVLIGEGPAKASLIEKAEVLRVRNLVEFRDSVPKKSLWGIIGDTDAFLMIVKPMQSFEKGMSPNKLWDYFAAARPIIFSTIGGDEIAKESGGGISVKPGDAFSLVEGIERLYAMNNEEREQMGRNGRQYVAEKADIPKLVERLESLLTRVVGNNMPEAYQHEI